MKSHTLLIAFSCCLAFSANLSRAQARDCQPPKPDTRLSPDEQKAAADGYKYVCKSANAARNAEMSKSKSAYSVDEYVPATPEIEPVHAGGTLSDYLNWLDAEKDACPRLAAQARDALATYSDPRSKLVYLRTIHDYLQGDPHCR